MTLRLAAVAVAIRRLSPATTPDLTVSYQAAFLHGIAWSPCPTRVPGMTALQLRLSTRRS